ncbi:EF-hand domain-containing protein [Paracidovorax citrulli]|uniref:EF-hand domain-containing protein n=1 Tax=Paracidovorax citrulli TaxID=80869 RepID=UPI001E29260A|nr:EF-hand domain-containing protein [Paracidovorax citrulli]
MKACSTSTEPDIHASYAATTTHHHLRCPQRDALRGHRRGKRRGACADLPHNVLGGNALHAIAFRHHVHGRPRALRCGQQPGHLRGTSPATSASASFDRADADKDGKLSAQEAARLPAISQHFKELDTNHDGALSRTEFEAGAKS